MKCPNCGAEVLEGDKFCGNCGKLVVIEISPLWKWGSMIASLLIIIWIWYEQIRYPFGGTSTFIFLFFWALIALPIIIYLMRKERLEETKYEQKLKYAGVWISIVALGFLISRLGIFYNQFWATQEMTWEFWMNFLIPTLLAIPAFIIDIIYLYKTKN